MPGIQKQATKLGVGKYYGLFACMVAARTFDDIADAGVGHTEEVGTGGCAFQPFYWWLCLLTFLLVAVLYNLFTGGCAF